MKMDKTYHGEEVKSKSITALQIMKYVAEMKKSPEEEKNEEQNNE